MKTTLLILFLCLAGFGLWAQLPALPAANDANAVSNRAEMLRRALRSTAPGATNVTVIGMPPGAPAGSNTLASPAAVVPAALDATVATNLAPRLGLVSPATSAAEPPGMDETIPPGMVTFVGMDFNQVLDTYARLVNKTILRPSGLATPVITLKAQTALTKREAIQALEAIFAMNGISMIPMGEKFIKAVPSAEAGQHGGMFSSTDPTNMPDFGSFVTHVVQMTYAKPSEVRDVLVPFARLQGGILPIDSSGILVLRDYTENVKRMLEMIKQVDVAIPAEIVSEVIPIKFAEATAIASALSSVGGNTVATMGASSGAGRPGSTLGGRTGGPGYSGAGGLGSQGTAARLGNIPGANTGGINPPATGLGAGTGAAGTGSDFTSRIRAIINRASTPGGGGDFQILGQTKIIPDERSNSLLVFATRQDMDMIKKIISQLDVVLAQVLIEAIILDVTLGDSFNFGVSGGQQPLTLGKPGSGNVVGGSINNGNGSVNSGLSFLNSFISGVGSNGVATSFPTSDGLTYFGKIGPTWNVAMSALAGNNNVKVLARPSIQTSHNVPAHIFVGETRPYISGTYFDAYNNGSRSQYQQTQIGITLDVTPLINPGGLVVMDIAQSVQQVGGSVTIDGNAVPITQDQNANAKVSVQNGETIVMGGFIQSQKSAAKSGIPLLKDIPLLGGLFRSTSTSGSRRELLVMIRPTVLPTPQAASQQTDAQRNSHPNLKEAEMEFKAEETKMLKHAESMTRKEEERLFNRDTPVTPAP